MEQTAEVENTYYKTENREFQSNRDFLDYLAEYFDRLGIEVILNESNKTEFLKDLSALYYGEIDTVKVPTTEDTKFRRQLMLGERVLYQPVLTKRILGKYGETQEQLIIYSTPIGRFSFDKEISILIVDLIDNQTNKRQTEIILSRRKQFNVDYINT